MRLRIIISGEKVHNVGYRPFLLSIAENLEIEKFFAENIILNGKEAVEILIEGEDKDIDDFYKIISSKFPNNAKVSEIKKDEHKGRIMSIEGYYRYLTASQLSKIATYCGKMLENQDKTIAVIKEEGEKIREELGTKIDITRDELKYEVSGLREDLKSYLDRRMAKIEEDIAIIKARIGLVG